MPASPTTTATTHRPELTPVTNHKGEQKYADAGATKQGKRAAIKQCTACGGFVVFVQSTKTGKWYLADCFRYHGDSITDAYYYRKDAPHFASCEKIQASNTRMVREVLEQEQSRKSAAAIDAIFHDPANVDLDRAAILALVDAAVAEIAAEYATRIAEVQA